MVAVRVLVELMVGGQWVDITRDVYVREDISISRGRADEGAEVDPGTCSLVLNNRSGRYSPRNPRSPYHGRIGRNTPIRVSVRHGDRLIPRFVGEVAAWPPRWDLSGNDVYTPIEAAGILRRLNASSSPLQSSLVRFVLASGPAAYWPLTDGADTQNAAPLLGGNIAYLNNREGEITMPMRWTGFDLAPHLEPVATLPDKVLRGVFRGYILPGHRPQWWAAEFVRGGVGGFDSFGMQLVGAGTDADPTRMWYLGFDHPTRTLFVSYFRAGDSDARTTVLRQDIAAPQVFEADTAHVFRLECAPYQGGTSWRVCVDGVQIANGQLNESARPPLRWVYDWFVPDDNRAAPASLGHVTVWDGTVSPGPEQIMLAYHGHAGETAGQRIIRVCEETGLPVTVLGDPDDTQLVGAQQMTSPLDVLSAAAAADGGILHEDRAEPRLVYRTNRSRYNHGLQLSQEE
ncbi:hypothetical protein HFP72_06455 [Nocardiopsis sp. ARC36]